MSNVQPCCMTEKQNLHLVAAIFSNGVILLVLPSALKAP